LVLDGKRAPIRPHVGRKLLLRTLQMPGKAYEGIGRCIICLREDRELTREHIIPYALSFDAEVYINNGSCHVCNSGMNERFENIALQCDFKVARVLLALKRRKKKRPVQLDDVMIIDEHGEELAAVGLPVDSYPPHAMFVIEDPPGIITGVKRENRSGRMTVACIDLIPNGPRLLAAHQVKHKNVVGMAPMLAAKAGYCFAVAERGIDSFDGDAIRELLRGERSDIFDFVGGHSKSEQLSNRQLHRVFLRRRGRWLTAVVHLFASFNAPPWEVVLGEAR
jgi:hypothetical protein